MKETGKEEGCMEESKEAALEGKKDLQEDRRIEGCIKGKKDLHMIGFTEG